MCFDFIIHSHFATFRRYKIDEIEGSWLNELGNKWSIFSLRHYTWQFDVYSLYRDYISDLLYVMHSFFLFKIILLSVLIFTVFWFLPNFVISHHRGHTAIVNKILLVFLDFQFPSLSLLFFLCYCPFYFQPPCYYHNPYCTSSISPYLMRFTSRCFSIILLSFFINFICFLLYPFSQGCSLLNSCFPYHWCQFCCWVLSRASTLYPPSLVAFKT
jgi:hypothetical protein